MLLTINGDAREIEAGTVLEFLESRNLSSQMVVVEHNGEILPRDRFGEVRLNVGDVLEIVQMMAGG